MTKEELKKYTTLKTELKLIKQQIEKLQHDKYNFKAVSYSDMPKGNNSNYDKIGEAIVKLESKIEEYCIKYEQSLEELDKIEKVINSLNGMERLIMRYRYIDNMKWEKICILTQYSWRQVHNIHSRILKKIL